MQKGEIRRSSGAVWRERVERQERSGLSVQEFCDREGVSAWSLYRWKRRLRTGNDPAKRVSKPAGFVRGEPVPSPEAFIDLGALRSEREGPGWEIRLELGGGVILQLARR
jgi:transposase-like protein